MIYTTYFGKLNSHPELLQKVTPIAICAKSPDGYSGMAFPSLAPSYKIFKQYKDTGDEKTFEQMYREEILARLDAKQCAQQLTLMTEVGRCPALVCYEKAGSFCHRKIVADWLRSAGEEVQEL